MKFQGNGILREIGGEFFTEVQYSVNSGGRITGKPVYTLEGKLSPIQGKKKPLLIECMAKDSLDPEVQKYLLETEDNRCFELQITSLDTLTNKRISAKGNEVECS
jgi:hypothetical protein